MNSESGKRMLGYVYGYERSTVMQNLFDAEGAELDKLIQALDEVLDQFFVRTATWGLDQWEKELGLPVTPNKPVKERQDKIISMLRGLGTATIKLIKNVSESFDYGEIDIVEDFPAYTITVKFASKAGIPPNLEDMKKAIRDVVPAHLDIKFEFKYFTWDDLDAKGWTWDELEALNLTWDELEVYS